MMKTTLIRAFALAGALLSGFAYASEMWCGEQLVTQGMTQEQVKAICHEPTSTEKYGTVWVYDQGPDQFLKVITFVNGEVEFINDRSREVGPD
jgi:hypothetical protein